MESSLNGLGTVSNWSFLSFAMESGRFKAESLLVWCLVKKLKQAVR
jgi:hypothetical protein